MTTTLTHIRNAETNLTVVNNTHPPPVAKNNGRWHCSCPARGMCKHLRTVLACFGMGIGNTLALASLTDSSNDDGLLSPDEFDAEAGHDVRAEINYIRSGREKRNYGC